MRKNKRKIPVKRIVLIGIFAVLAVFVTAVVINVYVGLNADNYIVDSIKALPKGVDAIIVPGAGLNSENKPGAVLKDRLDGAIKLYKAGLSNRILMSGDHGDIYHNEVLAMKEYAIEQGIPSDNIFMDHAGFTTYDTMIRARDVFTVRSAIIVTQNYHMYRSVYIARSLGIDAYGMPSDIRIDQWKYVPLETREFFARVKAFFTVLFKSEPYFGGDEIPISGSGNATDD